MIGSAVAGYGEQVLVASRRPHSPALEVLWGEGWNYAGYGDGTQHPDAAFTPERQRFVLTRIVPVGSELPDLASFPDDERAKWVSIAEAPVEWRLVVWAGRSVGFWTPRLAPWWSDEVPGLSVEAPRELRPRWRATLVVEPDVEICVEDETAEAVIARVERACRAVAEVLAGTPGDRVILTRS